MDLPSFTWLWRIAAWSMGISITLYFSLAIVGIFYRMQRLRRKLYYWRWLRYLHYGLGVLFVFFVLLLLGIGIVGTLGHFGSLGHSWHLPAGLGVVTLTLVSAWTASRIHPRRPWARTWHLGLNIALFVGLALVSLSGWSVVQKYLP
ncbi:MAG: DUF4079 domain-containing protein [Prochloron sp. SP5CPC1]|nr:DUF4079 domain-containing protein [Candidatus Paraprochloron terpiosi SP5CPC1]